MRLSIDGNLSDLSKINDESTESVNEFLPGILFYKRLVLLQQELLSRS